MDVEVRLLLGGHAPVSADELEGKPIRWADLPAVTVSAPNGRRLREVFEEAFALFERDQGLSYHGGHRHDILFSLYTRGFEENVHAELASDGPFGIDADGRLVLDDDRLRRLTVGHLRRAAGSGLTSRDPNRLVAYELWAEASERITGTIATFLNQHWEFLVPYALSFGYRLVPRLRYRRIRRQVAQWHRQGIHDAWQIRGFLARRNEWTPSQVGKLLSLDEPSAARLLEAMGYIQLDTGLYVLGKSEEATKRRDAWIAAEWRAER